ncbi:MAG: recombinase zinc beta ribbon domain-containing protein [Chloroflexi bacterium]|nr:recombinase zinc beta ribbon domain-containing protein [Chloroflexota bacterium]
MEHSVSKKGRGAAREGPGLLARLIVCGKCGRRMTVSYGKDHHVYWCRRELLTDAAPQCQAFSLRHLDAAIRDRFFAAVQPARLETILTALDVLDQERRALDHQWQLKLERARYAVRLAERQYDAVDPENRLVARALETRWNDALAALQALERDDAKAQRTELAPLTDAEQQAVRQLADDLPAVWEAPTTQMADRKQLQRLVIQEVQVTVTRAASPREAEIAILWSGGATTTHTVTCPKPGWHCLTDPAVVATIRALAQELPDYQIAERLNAEGVRTRTGKVWTHALILSWS